MSGIELYFTSSTGSIDLFLNVGSPWQSDSNEYYSNISFSTLGWNYFDVSSANISLSAGDMFVIGLQPIGIATSIGGDSINGYALGDLYVNGSEYVGRDFAFKTYVEVAAVPEPSTIVLLSTGLIGIILLLRRKTINSKYKII